MQASWYSRQLLVLSPFHCLHPAGAQPKGCYNLDKPPGETAVQQCLMALFGLPCAPGSCGSPPQTPCCPAGRHTRPALHGRHVDVSHKFAKASNTCAGGRVHFCCCSALIHALCAATRLESPCIFHIRHYKRLGPPLLLQEQHLQGPLLALTVPATALRGVHVLSHLQ
jgi:hypothetical protein